MKPEQRNKKLKKTIVVGPNWAGSPADRLRREGFAPAQSGEQGLATLSGATLV
jgi:hypothetical protein